MHSTQHRGGPPDRPDGLLQQNHCKPFWWTLQTSQHKAKHSITQGCLQAQQKAANTAQKTAKQNSTCSRRSHDGSHTRLPQSPCHPRQNLPPRALQPHAHISKLYIQHWSGSFLGTRAAHPGACQYHPHLGGVSRVAGGLTHEGGVVSRAWGRAPKGSPNRHMD